MKLRILAAGLIYGLVALAAESGPELFQKAVTLEKANGNLGEAIKLYQRIAKEFSSDRALAAKALIQAAHCYELLGQGEQAVKFYEQVTLDFGDERQPVETARAKLASLRFEVVSVRKTMPDAKGGYGNPQTRGGPGTPSVNYINLRLETLIEIAYDLKEYQLLGPDWLRSTDSEPFVINATIRPGATKEQVNQMLRNLLAERFKLTVHREARDLPVYELVLVKRGPKLKESLKQGAGKENGSSGEPLPPAKLAGVAASFGLLEEKDGFLRLLPRGLLPPFGGPAATWSTPPVQHAVGGNQTIAGLVTYLSHASQQYYGRPVVDKTGLTGNWDYNLEYVNNTGAASSPDSVSDHAPDLINAVRDQLGLKMEPKKDPIEAWIWISWMTFSTTWLALSIRLTMGSRICPLLRQNCSTTAADSLAARVTIWYGFFTAVGSFLGFVFGNRILSKPAPPPLPTFNYEWDILSVIRKEGKDDNDNYDEG